MGRAQMVGSLPALGLTTRRCVPLPLAGAWNGNSTAGAWGGAATNSSYSAPSSGFVAPVAQAVDSGVRSCSWSCPGVLSVTSLGQAGPLTPLLTRLPAAQDTRKREADVARREAELTKREAEVRRMEMELANSPGAKNNKNWPKFCPVAHHDIAGEVPAAKQGMVRSAYWAYLGMVWCMFFNFVAVTGALIVNSGDNLSAWLWAVIYGLGGIPLGFTLWYMRVYNAAIKDRALSYGLFFIFFMAHLIFVGWSAVGEAPSLFWLARLADSSPAIEPAGCA